VAGPLAFDFVRHDDFTFTLLSLAVVLVVARLAGLLAQRLGQPPVLGEMIGGIALSSTLLGGFSTELFPAESRPLLKILSTIGLIVFMALMGLDMEMAHLRGGRNRVAGSVAFFGTAIPFGLGVLLGLALYGSHEGVDRAAFLLFMGAAMSITAFPVLARILLERKLFDTPLGVLAMACAAGDDALTWATLVLVLGLAASGSAWDLPYICAVGAVYTVVLWRFGRPLFARYLAGRSDATLASVVVIGVLLSAYVTAAIGLHEILGAFLFGAVLPRGAVAAQLRRLLAPITWVLLPVFFVTTGLAVDIGGLDLDSLWQLGLILLVAVSGKLIGATIGARWQGLALRESVAVGVLMNTRGLTELLVLTIGREVGVIDDELFTLLVIMAVATTVATAPLLRLVRPDPMLGSAPAAATDPADPAEPRPA
jgi:Kef-type K+ transport system membrane component KefB